MPRNMGIRAAILEHPADRSAKDVVEALKKSGLETSDNYVHTVRSDDRKRRGALVRPRTVKKEIDKISKPKFNFLEVSVDAAIAAVRLSDKKSLTLDETKLAALIADIGLVRTEQLIQGLRSVSHDLKYGPV